MNGLNYVGDKGEGGTKYLNYEGHPGIDYAASYDKKTGMGTAVFAAVSGSLFYPWQVIGTGLGKTGYDTYCRFHTLGEVPDDAPTYRIYYLHLSTHPNQLKLAGFPADPPCKANQYNTPGEQEPISAVSGCYTLNGQPFSPTTLPLPYGTHANAGCQIAFSGEAGVPGSPHLHFEIQQIVPSGAAVNASALSYFHCWDENSGYSRKNKSFCLPADPYGWTGGTSNCPPNNPAQWTGDIWYCLTGIPARRFWTQ